MTFEKEYRKLCGRFWYHTHLYESTLETILEDWEFDLIKRDIVILEEKYPELITNRSPTQAMYSKSICKWCSLTKKLDHLKTTLNDPT